MRARQAQHGGERLSIAELSESMQIDAAQIGKSIRANVVIVDDVFTMGRTFKATQAVLCARHDVERAKRPRRRGPEHLAFVPSLDHLMCGRFALYGPISLRHDMKQEAWDWVLPLVNRIEHRPPRFNFAPMQAAPIVHATADGTAIDDMRWGLVPAWAKDVKIGNKAINARVETVAEKPMFRSAFKTRRCLVPANGYFEWRALPRTSSGTSSMRPINRCCSLQASGSAGGP